MYYVLIRVAVAWVQMPSSLPTNPKPSNVVAPIPTNSFAMPRAVDSDFVISGINESSFGFSAMMVAETLSTLYPFSFIISKTFVNKSKLLASLYFGSLSEK